MADYTIKIIPADPYRRIPEDRINMAADYLQGNVSADRIETAAYETPAFIDCGGNLESIECPLCGSHIDFDWWGEAMDEAAEGEFSDLSAVMPCCGGKISLNELKYDFPCGFACSEVKILNPDNEVSGECMENIRRLFSADIRVIRSRM